MNHQLINRRPQQALISAEQTPNARPLSPVVQPDDRAVRLPLAEIVQKTSLISPDTLAMFVDGIRQSGGEFEFRETITIIEE